ncbi:hypothetical protein HRI_003849100 [Hibiscus trionum]|uniref:RING-type E3 ubiquitin transferase n=1 Tax=Hibiscus trionum TaxID=183268 RepID=A0A9W7IXN4_HIBTR|nr:hypothetical protein HRI_003849100 [Hibiscus trionum]
MASSEPQFQMKVEHCLIPNTAPQLPNVEFLLHIRTSVRDDHGCVWQDPWQPDTQEEIVVLPESVFGSELHRNVISRRLLEAGWLDQGHRELILDLGFSVSNSIIEKEKEKKKKNQNNNTSDETLRIIFRVEKIVRMEYYDEFDLEATAMELSMQEEPKPVPATIESIQALKKTKLVEGFGNGDDIECMICMEKLVSSESEVVTCMPCSHLFHADCIERWLNTCHICPLCRFPMPTDAGNH